MGRVGGMDYSLAAQVVQIGLLLIVIKLQFELAQRLIVLLNNFAPLVEKIEQFGQLAAGEVEPPTYIQQVLGNFLMSRMQQENDQAINLTRDESGKFSKE